MKFAIGFFVAIISGFAIAQTSEQISCEKLAQLNDQHFQLLKVGAPKSEVLTIMGSYKCDAAENPVKTSSFRAGSDNIEILWYTTSKVGTNQPDLKPVFLINGAYSGQRPGFNTSPQSGS